LRLLNSSSAALICQRASLLHPARRLESGRPPPNRLGSTPRAQRPAHAAGDKAVLFNGHGREVTAEVTALGAREVELRKLHEAATPPLRCRITLGQAIPKGKNMDLIVQKAVEIGAAEIVPIISDRTIVRLDADDAAQKQSKWQTVAIEAPSNAARTGCRKCRRRARWRSSSANARASIFSSSARYNPTRCT
jgi:hypothetical protein